MPTILFEIKDNIAYITFNRPGKMNAINREMALLFQEKLDHCQTDKSIRCVYISGVDKSFCAGQDLSEVIEPDGKSINKILREQFNPIVWKIRTLEKPVVGAINGVAAGAGANLALACDVVVASESAYFVQAFSKIGLVPDTGGTYILPRFIGWQRASALMMLADKISASEAERMGMLYKVFSDATFDLESKKIAEKLSAMPTRSLAMIKHALNFSVSNTFEQQLKIEDIYQQRAIETHDYKEGVQAFMEKRKPDFIGE
ncbi:MAG TPA: enoyl-CoA hydratase-related protein [Panacibacter sp.]|nr:enoyl-CoA hydratase-related protein [Panacibacter sp.]HNP44974.1 enoyl-CoA hydratase-related protein [Panacibacter sp.]